MLEPILKGLVEWIYEMMLDIMAYASGELIDVMSMDLTYFEKTAPVVSEIVDVFIALGWALLLGNLVFQALKAMMSGAGFEAEDPKTLFLRTFVFAFLLLASRQICSICSSIAGSVISMLEIPESINVVTPDESMFSLGSGAKWLLVIIVGVILMIQIVKLLFEIGERYVITGVLTFFAPLAFSMGGSKNTNDIFKGWCRMYGSMLLMMILNIVFLKLIMSAMSQMTSGGVLVWLVFVVALTRVARKIDSHIGKLGLNPAQTGDGIGSRMPGIMTVLALKKLGSMLANGMSKFGQGGRQFGGFGWNPYPGSYYSSGRHISGGSNGGSLPNIGIGGKVATNTTNSSSSQTNNNTTNEGNGGQNNSNNHNKGGYRGKKYNRGRQGNNYNGYYNNGRNNGYNGNNKGYKKGGYYNKGYNNGTNNGGYKKGGKQGGYSGYDKQDDIREKISEEINMMNNQNNHSSHTEHRQGGSQPSRPPLSRNTSGQNPQGSHYEGRDFEHHSHSSSHSQTNNQSTQNRVNHQYKQGRYNPAASNKKSKNSYYQKDYSRREPPYKCAPPKETPHNTNPNNKRYTDSRNKSKSGGNNGKQRKK